MTLTIEAALTTTIPSLTAFLVALVLSVSTDVFAVDGKLTVYTSQPNTDAPQTINTFKAKYPNVEITLVRDGTK